MKYMGTRTLTPCALEYSTSSQTNSCFVFQLKRGVRSVYGVQQRAQAQHLDNIETCEKVVSNGGTEQVTAYTGGTERYGVVG